MWAAVPVAQHGDETYYAIVVAAYNAAGHSKFIIAEAGPWCSDAGCEGPWRDPDSRAAAERILLSGTRRDLDGDCAPLRKGLPAKAVAAIGCAPQDGIVKSATIYGSHPTAMSRRRTSRG